MERWSTRSFVERYLAAREVIVVELGRMTELLRSLYRQHMQSRSGRIIDLGCGDGFLTWELLKADPGASATLVDSSGEMLRRARERLAGFNVRFIRCRFEELVDMELPRADLAVSSLALHHLTRGEKMELLRYLHSLLRGGGLFVNIDLVKAPSEELREWYLSLWREWIEERRQLLGVKEEYQELVERCLAEEHYTRLGTLEEELRLLRSAGFAGVDCFYKHGMFAMYGGGTER